MFENLQDRLNHIFNKITGRGALSEQDVEDALREIRRAFLEADVALDVVRDFSERIKEKAIGAKILKSIKPGQMVIKIVHDELQKILGEETYPISLQATPPVPIMLVGLQGAGKTTTSAKIAKKFKEKQNKKVLMVSLDTARPAAQEQLQQLGLQINVDTLPIIKGQDAIEITKRAMETAKLNGYDVLLLDTAGRTHIDENLMDEAEKIKNLANPHEILLVADSLTGQDAVHIAKAFNDQLEITGIILTRMDGDGRGGAALSMKHVTGKPIKAISLGEKLEDLEDFHPKRIADRILGMGDILSLVEKASQAIDQKKSEMLAKKMQEGKFDLNDMKEQIQQMKKIGGLGGIMGMMPGLNQVKNKISQAGFNDNLLNKQLAIISSMTLEERQKPEILKHSRKQRIAKGSGTNASEINKLLKMHRQMADMMKGMKKGKGSFMSNLMGKIPGASLGFENNMMTDFENLKLAEKDFTKNAKIPAMDEDFSKINNLLEKSKIKLPGLPKNPFQKK